jgi:hypothetical protein
MSSTLIFPDGIRLARQDEIPGTEPSRSDAWAKVRLAKITCGFVLKPTGEEKYSHYAEINVDAPGLWNVFRSLCQAILGPSATLIASHIDETPSAIGSADLTSLFAVLQPHQYQLAHDGTLHFGLVSDQDKTFDEVFVAPTKHLKVWLNDDEGFRSVMRQHDLREVNKLEFIDEYPRATVALPADRIAFSDINELIAHIANKIAARPAGD